MSQVNCEGDQPWSQRADSGPDSQVPGWFYNLGITGIRAELVADQPKALLVKYVFPRTPARKLIKTPMGMAYEALGASIVPKDFRKLMDANRWWFTMAQCDDGTFYYQPNRDNSGYDSEARMTASSVVAFIFTIPKRNLAITDKELP